VTGSDVSSKAVARAAEEASARDLTLTCRFRVADMRTLSSSAQDMRYFDAVVALDNALPHLLSDNEITQALREFHRCLRPRGVCIVSVRDYDAVQRAPGAVQLLPYGVRKYDAPRQNVIALQTWEWDAEARTYELSLFLVFDSGTPNPATRVHRTRYYAVGISTLEICMQAAGFVGVRVERDAFFQPVILGFAPDKQVPGMPSGY
jgi:glycine/sarcosine N-methyltransferase